MKKKEKQVVGSVAVIFDSRGRVLLSQRYDPKQSWHKKWQFPGGGVEYGEHPIDTVHREIKEEIGIAIKILSPEPFVHSVVHEKHTKHIILLCFPARYIAGELDTSDDQETSDAAWFELSEIDYKSCFPGVKEILEKAKGYIM